ncbi:MAG: hypothetical protein FWG13_07790 [Leptospirales bacterium]|nr:hypothetical protein [Leptospirales bacterium]
MAVLRLSGLITPEKSLSGIKPFTLLSEYKPLRSIAKVNYKAGHDAVREEY